jgi:CHAD domain-containing protein
MDNQQRHRLRIEIKKLRYAVEFAEALHTRAEKQKRFGKSVQDLQEALGHLNDAAVARTLAPADPWLVEPDTPSKEERAYVREAEDTLDRLRKIGPYWRAKAG